MAEVVVRCIRALRSLLFGHEPSRAQWESRCVRSDFLVAQPSTLSGIASLGDWFGQFHAYNMSATPAQADNLALYSDWRVIGNDLIVTAHSLYPELVENAQMAAPTDRVETE